MNLPQSLQAELLSFQELGICTKYSWPAKTAVWKNAT